MSFIGGVLSWFEDEQRLKPLDKSRNQQVQFSLSDEKRQRSKPPEKCDQVGEQLNAANEEILASGPPVETPVENTPQELEHCADCGRQKGGSKTMYGTYRPYDADAEASCNNSPMPRPMLSSTVRDEVTSQYRTNRDTRLIRDIEDYAGYTVRAKQRLIGEISFQLDRRILGYVFGYFVGRSDPRRFYGYSVKNIPEKIMQESYADPAFSGVERHLREIRYDTVCARLRSLGYMVAIHSDMCADLVNTFGLLPVPIDRMGTSALFFWDNRRALKDVLRDITPIQLWPDVNIIFECLASMALHDGKPMLTW